MKIGDHIRPVDETGDYIVMNISGSQVEAEDEHGFVRRFDIGDVILIKHSLLEQKVKHSLYIPESKDSESKKSVPHKRNQKKNVYELDLHAGSLIGNTSGMTAHEILIEQIAQAKAAIEKARTRGFSHVVLIHGKGKGRLRQELHELLAGMQRLEYYDASFADYNMGATEVMLK